jgi:hypothetical protein
MTLSERLEAMEVLWASIARDPGYTPPAWHAEVLAQRAKEAAEHPENFESRGEVKRRLRERSKP